MSKKGGFVAGVVVVLGRRRKLGLEKM